MRATALIVAAAIAACVPVPPGPGPQSTKGGTPVADASNQTDERFARFEGDLFEEWEGTPEVDPMFRGLKIAGPKNVLISESWPGAEDGIFGPLVIAGTYMVGDELPAEIGRPEDEIVLVAIDQQSNEAFSSDMGGEGDPAEPPEGFEQGEPEAGVVTQGYFNPNLFEFLHLPFKETKYVVYATLGPHRSNALEIDVRKAR